MRDQGETMGESILRHTCAGSGFRNIQTLDLLLLEREEALSSCPLTQALQDFSYQKQVLTCKRGEKSGLQLKNSEDLVVPEELTLYKCTSASGPKNHTSRTCDPPPPFTCASTGGDPNVKQEVFLALLGWGFSRM